MLCHQNNIQRNTGLASPEDLDQAFNTWLGLQHHALPYSRYRVAGLLDNLIESWLVGQWFTLPGTGSLWRIIYMQSIEYSGLFWLPSNPDNRVAGSLSFTDEDGITLQLIGSFGELDTFESTKAHPLVLGLSTNGKKITLTHCIAMSKKVSMPGFYIEGYRGNFCFVGGHFQEPNELRFRRLAVRYSHLPDWVRMSGFSVTRKSEEHKVEIVYELPQEVKAETSKGIISLSFSGQMTGDGIERMNIEQSVWLEVEIVEEVELQTLFRQYVSALQNFLTLATTKPNSIIELQVFSPLVYMERQNDERIEIPIQVLFRQKYLKELPHELLMPDYMLFVLEDVFDDFEVIMDNWLNMAQELDSVCNRFFGVQYTTRMNLQNEFLNIVQALESYHRQRMKNEVQPRVEYKRRIEAILSRVDTQDRHWLREILAYGNEPRLEQRLNELLEKVHAVVSPVIDDTAIFAKKVKNTRHYLTHLDKSKKRKAARGAELYWLTRKLSYVLQACLLLELGLSLDKSAALLHRNQSFILTPSLEDEGKR